MKPFYFHFFLYLGLLVFGLGAFPLIDWDENIYGAVSKSMWESGEYFRLSVNAQLYAEKPPFFFWLICSSFAFFGVNEFAVRIPSLLSGLACFCLLYWFGFQLKSKAFGLLWAMVYSAAFLPLLLSRTAYIDHLFNTFLALGIFGLYELDSTGTHQKKRRLGLLLGTGLALGFGTLTKGPIAIALPVFCGVVLFFWEKRFPLRISEILVGFFATLLPLGFFYGINFSLYGWGLLEGFADFQGKLFSKSLESHSGPWFYHFLIALPAFLPWSFFLLFSQNWRKWNMEIPRLERLFLAWIVFIFGLFSLVQTKLPHYSSSVYIPLSFWVARLLCDRIENHTSQKSKDAFLLYFPSFLLGLGFLLLPWVFSELTESSEFQRFFGIQNKRLFFAQGWIPGLVLVLGAVLGFCLFRTKLKLGVLTLWLSYQIFLSSFCIWVAPPLLSVLQDKNLTLYDVAQERGLYVGYYKYLSFLPFFYREEPMFLIGNYKFREDKHLLEKVPDRPLGLITPSKNLLELRFLYPQRKFSVLAEAGELLLLLVE